MQEPIVARATEVAVKEEAVAAGMRSMRADSLAKALAGRTTLEEVLRVTPPKILVVDDDQAIAEVAAAVLVDGYEVVAAGQAEEGLRMAGAERPDLVLVDLDLPVLVMSASDDRHTRDRAAAAGATGFIPKPFSEGQLRAEVAAVLQRRPALAEHPA